MPAPKKSGKISQTIESTKAANVLAFVKTVKQADALADIASAQVGIQKMLADVSATVSGKLAQVETIDAAIALKKQELVDLHGVGDTATSLDDLEAEIDAVRVSWAKESAAVDAERLLEQQEFNAALTRQRRKEAEQFADTLQRRNLEEAMRQESFNRSLADRDAQMKLKETEFAALKAQVDAFPAAQKSYADKEVAIATNSLKRDYNQQLQMAQLNSDNATKMFQAQLESANREILQKTGEITTLRLELASANARAESIASKALEAQSGRLALEAVQRSAETSAMGKQK